MIFVFIALLLIFSIGFVIFAITRKSPSLIYTSVYLLALVLADGSSFPSIVVFLAWSGHFPSWLWPVAANLWWIVLGLGPLVVLAQRQKLGLGLIVTAALAVGAYAVPKAVIAVARAAVQPAGVAVTEGAALVLGPLPRSLEIVRAADDSQGSALGEMACDHIC